MDMINNPEKILEELLLEDGISSFQKQFLIDHSIYLTCDDTAKSALAEKAAAESRKVSALCNDLFGDFFHGIRLMKLENFTIPGEAVAGPKEYLDNYIKKNYSKK